MVDVFISYVREDRPFAERLASQLHRAGFNVWWDRQLLGGDDITSVIDEKISEARAIVVLWSEASSASTWVRSEASAGHALSKLVPVQIDDAPLPRPFDQLHTLDLAGWQGGWNASISELVKSIRRAFKGKPPKHHPSLHKRRTRRWISAGAVASSVLVALAVIADVSGLITYLIGENRDAKLSQDIEKIGEKLETVSLAVYKTEDLSISQKSVQKILRELRLAGLDDGAGVYALMQTGDLGDAVDKLQQDYFELPLDVSQQARIALLHQIAALSIDAFPDKSAATYEEVLRLDPHDPIAHTQLARLNLRGRVAEPEEPRLASQDISSVQAEMMQTVLTIMGEATPENVDASIEKLEHIAARASALEYKDVEARAGLMKIQIHIAYGKKPAERFLETAQGILDSTQANGYPDLELLALSTLGVLQYKIEDFANAANTYRAMIGLARDLDRKDAIVNGYATLASVQTKTGDLEQAKRNVAHALILARETKSLSGYLQHLWAQSAVIDIKLQDIASGCRFAERAFTAEERSRSDLVQSFPELNECQA